MSLYIGGISMNNAQDDFPLIGMLLYAIVMGLIIYTMIIRPFRCPKCKRYSSFRYKGKQIINKENTSIRTEIKTRNNKGEVVSTSEQYIPGTRYTYQKTAKCKYCSYCKHKKYTKEYKD